MQNFEDSQGDFNKHSENPGLTFDQLLDYGIAEDIAEEIARTTLQLVLYFIIT